VETCTYHFNTDKQVHLRAKGHAKLWRFCHALGMPSDFVEATAIFDVMSESWSARPSIAPPAFASDITDDHSPFELSLALEGGQPELRMLVEAQGAPADLASNWQASLRLNDRLARVYGVSLDRANLVADVFRPDDAGARFAIWHAACLRREGVPTFKLYFNPQANGTARAASSVKEALARLGFARAWDWLTTNALRCDRHQLVYFSLDLSGGTEARVKIYVAYDAATAGEVEEVMSRAPRYHAGDARAFCTAMTGSDGPYRARPVILCMAFVAADDACPKTVTFHLPIRCYVKDDLVAMQRICGFLPGADAALYQRALTSLADRRLDDGVGLQTYASIRREGDGMRLTTYLSPELYGVARPRRVV
jgi:DMATS type aromatic prenyltransferase